jgi:predicted nucleic acid-binding Zn ribbon protein
MRTIRLSFLLLCFLISTSISYAKFCSECGKTLNEDAKFCSECGTGVNGNTRTNTNNAIDKSSVQFVYEKLKSLDEFCVYLNSTTNKLTWMQKFPDCKFKFEEGIKELQKENLSELQKSLIDLYLLKWDLVEIAYNKILKYDDKYGWRIREETAYMNKISRGITEILSNERNANWSKKYVEACHKCMELKKYLFTVTSHYLSLTGNPEDIFKRIKKGKKIRILDIKEDSFFIIGEIIDFEDAGWINREEVYKRTNLNKSPTDEKIKEIDEIQKLLK